MSLLEGKDDHPHRLNATLHDDVASLQKARSAEDQRRVNFVESLNEGDFEKVWDYKTLNATRQRQRLREILAHHQAHHRGRAHAALTALGINEPEPLDLLVMLRDRN
jgi:uncharacterized damage-inducible protein DinB